MDGLARTTKAKASPARARAEASKTKPKFGKGKGKNKNKGKGKHHGKKGKNGCHEMEVHDDTQDAQTGYDDAEWTDTCWDHTDNWTAADWWSSDWSTDLWTDPAWEQAARQVPPTQPAQERSNPTHGGSISMLGGLTMWELSVGDQRLQSEQDERGQQFVRQLEQLGCENWSSENGQKIGLTDGHKIEHDGWSGHKLEPEQDDGLSQNLEQNTGSSDKMRGGHNIWIRSWQDNWVCDMLTDHSIESVGQAVGVGSDKSFRQTTYGVDTASCRTVVPARHPATTRWILVSLETRKLELPYSTAGKSGMRVDVCLSKDTEGKPITIESQEAEVRRSLMAVKPMTQQGQWVCFGS